jgi:transposase
VQIDLDALPDDSAILQQMLREVISAATQRDAELNAENDKLRLLIHRYLRHRFGPRSEQLDPDQRQLGLEDLEQEIAASESAQDAGEVPGDQGRQRASQRNRNRGGLPAHLPRIEVVIDLESKQCPCCGGRRHAIGEDVSEMLDIIPAQLRVKVTRRPKYACRSCESAIVQASAPERPIDGGMATEALIAHVVVSKFLDHLPLYRQSQILARQGIALDRSTLSTWVGRACWWLKPLYDLIVKTVLSSDSLLADDTTLPVLDPGRGRTKTGRLWCYAVDERPWSGTAAPAVAYIYSEDRKAERPASHLAAFRGTLQVDGYSGFKSLAESRPEGAIRLAFCWAHVRRRFYEIQAANPAPLATEVLKRIAALYKIEAEIRGRPAETRQAIRQERSRPLVQELHAWLQQQLNRVSGKSAIAEAIRYALNHWEGLIVFLDDGRIELDTNAVERAIRPVALNRKNTLFAGSDSGACHWATIMTLIQTAKLNGIEPLSYLTDILQRIVSGRTKSRDLESMLPWNWPPDTCLQPNAATA